jgi:phage FluMu protein Com
MRRVPQDRTFRGLVGYHVGCPRCGFVTAVMNGDEGVMIEEHGDVVTFSRAARCVFCAVLLHLVDGELATEEGPDVRHVRFR